MDASGLGLGDVLYQTQGKSESKCSTCKLEFIALMWEVTEQFHEYLDGNAFDVHTDNSPLNYILTTAKIDATDHHCIASVANYNFRLHYKSGKSSGEAVPCPEYHGIW